jgi:hypothetical protein
MDLASSLAISGFLLISAIAMMAWHLRAWRTAQTHEMDQRERDYRRRQFRRRMQTTAMLAGLAIALPLGQLVIAPWPKVGVIFWGLVLIVLAWVALLAIADIVATKIYFGRVRDEFLIEQARLQGELRKAQKIQSLPSNGKAKDVFRRPPGVKDQGPENNT